MSTITIPAELVPLVRDGCYSDLQGQLEATSSVIEHRRGDTCAQVDDGLARADATRALLDVIGWFEPVDEDYAIDVNLHGHREAVLRAALERIGRERGIETNEHAGIEDRAQAKVNTEQLAAFVQRVEEGE